MEFVPNSRDSNHNDRTNHFLESRNVTEVSSPQIDPSSGGVHKYHNSFLNYGFTYVAAENYPLAECIVCGEKLSNENMVAKKLKKHFYSKHSDLADALLYDYFESKLKNQKPTFTERRRAASYKVAEIIANNLQPHATAETSILPACKEIVKSLLGKAEEWEISQVPLCSGVISRCINDMSADIQKQLIGNLQNTKFSLLLDVASTNQLLCYVRFLNGDSVVEQFLSCTELSSTVNVWHFITPLLARNVLLRENCVLICVSYMPLDLLQRLIPTLKIGFPNRDIANCLCRRESLIIETIPPDLKCVMETVIEMIKYIKLRPKETEVLKTMCQEAGTRHGILVLHTDVQWMSRSKVFLRFYEQRTELLEIFLTENPELALKITDTAWCSKLAYLVDIVEQLNDFSASIRWNEDNVFTYSEKLHGFLKKIRMWMGRIENNDLAMFPHASEIVQGVTPPLILEHLFALENALSQFFPSFNLKKYDWVRNPFTATTSDTTHLSLKGTQELKSIQADRSLQAKFGKVSLIRFWNSIKKQFPITADKALSMFLHFPSVYLSELGCSTLLNIIHKKEKRLISIEDELRVTLSTIQPRIELLCKNN